MRTRSLALRCRPTAVLVASAFIFASCGSGSTSDQSSTQDSFAQSPVDGDSSDGLPLAQVDTAGFDESALDAAEAAIDAYGDEGGFVAVILAFERGYDVEQIVDGTLAGGLNSDGTISISGALLDPSGLRAQVVKLPEPDVVDEGEESSGLAPMGFRRPTQSDAQIDPTLLFGELRGVDDQERGAALISAIISLSRSGYDLEQIVQEAILGGSLLLIDDSGCAQLGGVGSIIRPVRKDSACAADLLDLADELDDLDNGGEISASESTESEPTESAEASGDIRRFEGTFPVDNSDDSNSEGEILADPVIIEAGDTLSGTALLLANVAFFGGDLECAYVKYQFDELPMSEDGTYSGNASAEGAFLDVPCAGSTPPPPEDTGSIAATATIAGNTITVVLTDPTEDESFVITATLVDR